MARRNGSSLIEDLMKAPWWISAILAVISYLGLKFLVPSILHGSTGMLNQALAKAAPSFAPIVSLVFVFTAVMSVIVGVIKKKKEEQNSGRKRELFERQKSLPDISALKWREFEEFIGEAYKSQGYQVEEKGGSGADGGIDLILRKKGEMVLVQCKHWEAEQVGVKIVRELYGVVASEGATKGILVTTGYFTRDAELFAHGKPLLLIRGNELSRLIEEGQKSLISKPAKPYRIR
ncbi:MAG: restriction endonuclease [Thermodesulfovibrionales bacterium]